MYNIVLWFTSGVRLPYNQVKLLLDGDIFSLHQTASKSVITPTHPHTHTHQIVWRCRLCSQWGNECWRKPTWLRCETSSSTACWGFVNMHAWNILHINWNKNCSVPLHPHWPVTSTWVVHWLKLSTPGKEQIKSKPADACRSLLLFRIWRTVMGHLCCSHFDFTGYVVSAN